MFGSEILDVGVGLVLVFLSVSLICTGVREGIEGFMRTRAMDLERGIRELLQDPDGNSFAAELFKHPLISSLFAGDYTPAGIGPGGGNLSLGARWNLPSYIPAANFSAALIDIVARGKVQRPANGTSSPIPVDEKLSVEGLREAVKKIENPAIERALITAIDHAQGDLDLVRKNIEAWFNGTMDRVSGWYRRRTQLYLFIIGLGAAAFMNIDAIEVYKQLATDSTLRKAVVAQAGTVVSGGEQKLEAKSITALQNDMAAIGYPIGWKAGRPDPQSRLICLPPRDELHPNGDTFDRCWNRLGALWLQIILGWTITAFAVMLGAPFWFDVLNKLMVIRSTVKPREKSQEEGSEDRAAAKQ